MKGQPEPEVGMGATEIMWSDRAPYTIVKISKSKKTLYVQRDYATRIDNNGMSDCQSYEYSPNPDAPVIKLSLRRDGRWRKVGTKKGDGSIFAIGYREEYYDYSF